MWYYKSGHAIQELRSHFIIALYRSHGTTLEDKTVVIIILAIEFPALAMLLQVAFISHKGMLNTLCIV